MSIFTVSLCPPFEFAVCLHKGCNGKKEMSPKTDIVVDDIFLGPYKDHATSVLWSKSRVLTIMIVQK